MDSDDITESVYDWEVLKSLRIDHHLGGFLLSTFWVKSWVNNFQCANKSVRVDLVWESSINDDTIEVAWMS